MILKKISVLNYKNIAQAELAFSPKMNCFIGHNGEGKTNLLDAVYFLSFCKSATNSVDSQNIGTVKTSSCCRGSTNMSRESRKRYIAD